MTAKPEVRLRHPRNGADEAGFTLIELMVVILIIAILMAIAIPTYLGARNRAENRAAQSAIETSIRTLASSNASNVAPSGCVRFSTADEPAIHYVFWTQPSTGPNVVSMDSCMAGTGFAALSRTGRCWVVMDYYAVPGGGASPTRYGYMPASAGKPCSISNAYPYAGSSTWP